MRLIGFNEEKIKQLDKGQLAKLVYEENHYLDNLKNLGLSGIAPVSPITEFTIVMLAHDLSGQDNLIAVVFECGKVYKWGTEIHVALFDKQGRDMGLMYFPKSRTIEGVANELANCSLTKPIMLSRDADFFEVAMQSLYDNNKDDINKMSCYTYFQKLLDDYLVYKNRRPEV